MTIVNMGIPMLDDYFFLLPWFFAFHYRRIAYSGRQLYCYDKNMAFVRRRRTFKRRVALKKSTRRRPVRKAGTVSTVKRIAKQVVLRMAEKKLTYFESVDSGIDIHAASFTTWGVSEIQPVSVYSTALGGMQIGQGDTQAGRAGNRVRISSLKMKYILMPNAYNVTTNNTPRPLIFRMWFFYLKNDPVGPPVVADFADFFQEGNASTAPLGTLIDMVKNTNSDFFTVVKVVTHKLGFANYGGTGIDVAYQSFANNDYRLNHIRTIDLTGHVVKNLVFNDTISPPVTRALFMVSEVVSATNTGFAVDQVPARMWYSLEARFTDL